MLAQPNPLPSRILDTVVMDGAGNTKGGSIIVQLTPCLTGLD
jgi:hypothetical protein